jgi:hypothetical protein
MRLFLCLGFSAGLSLLDSCDAHAVEPAAAPAEDSVTASFARQAVQQGGAQQPPATPAQQAPAGLAVALGAPRLIAAATHSSRSMLVQAVYAATELSGAGAIGGITSTGTLKVTQAGAQYLPTPADKLVVELGSEKHEFVLEAVQGNHQAADPWTWMASPHQVRYRHALGDLAQAQIDVRFDGVNFEVKVKGKSRFGADSVAIDLAAKGRTGGERDYHGQDVTTQYALTGSLRGSGYEIDVKEEHALRMVSSTSMRLLQSMRGSASSVQTAIGSTLKSGGQTYAFQGLQVRSEYSEKGGQTKNQETQMAGAITRDGKPWAQCAIAGGVPVAQTSDGAVLPLGL